MGRLFLARDIEMARTALRVGHGFWAKCAVSRRWFAVEACDSFTRSSCTQRLFLGNRWRFLCGSDAVAVAMRFCDEKWPNLLLAAEVPCDFVCDSGKEKDDDHDQDFLKKAFWHISSWSSENLFLERKRRWPWPRFPQKGLATHMVMVLW